MFCMSIGVVYNLKKQKFPSTPRWLFIFLKQIRSLCGIEDSMLACFMLNQFKNSFQAQGFIISKAKRTNQSGYEKKTPWSIDDGSTTRLQLNKIIYFVFILALARSMLECIYVLYAPQYTAVVDTSRRYISIAFCF